MKYYRLSNFQQLNQNQINFQLIAVGSGRTDQD